MQALDDRSGPFARSGAWPPATPLVVSVPHAGRDYSPALLADSLLPQDVLAGLEDRHADRLADGLVALGATVLVAHTPRAMIDLNRDEREIDQAMLVHPRHPGGLIVSAKVRGGLGLIPRRIAGHGSIWRRRFTNDEIEARIADCHRPWHEAIAQALSAARARFGAAMLIDLHSMPPIAASVPGAAPRIVIGDRHGRSASADLVQRAIGVATAEDLIVSRNQPYAGGHTLERHGRPSANLHAIQIEVDRTLYLADNLRDLGGGLAATTALVTRIAEALLATLAASSIGTAPLAAE